jgi:hypothetical protein
MASKSSRQKWEKPRIEEVTEKIVLRPYIRFT